MNLQIYDFEKFNNTPEKKQNKKLSDDEINEKYESGEQRIVTEQGAYKLDLLGAIFSKDKYNLQPDFQRRIQKNQGNKKISINKNTGKITIKKGLRKGSYKVKATVYVTGNKKYDEAQQTVYLKIKIK